MVMHARKPLKRISDGYFEKHQAHPYQKYSKSDRRAQAEYGSSDSRYTPLRSPNGNVSHGHSTHPSQSSHSHHHYSHVVDDRGYSSSRNSYLPKGSEKERDRDYKSSRNKYTESVRSPKERSKDVERERSNHERNESQPDKKSRSSGLNVSVSRSSSKYDKRSTAAVAMPPGSEWSEHISSLGKRYYYNCITEVSQWVKPRDLETRRTASKDSTYSSRSRLEEAKKPPEWDKKHREKRSRSRSGRREAEKSSSKRPSNQSERYWNNSSRDNNSRDNSNRDNSNRDNSSRDNSNRDNSNRDNSNRDNSSRDNRDEEVHERTRPKHSTHDGKDGQSLQDMDISPDRSTPISENSYGAREASAAAARSGHADGTVPPVVVLDNSNLNTGSLLAAALPRIAALPAGAGAGASAGANGGGSPLTAGAGDTPPRDPGPPTPTHSENTDPHAPPLHLEQALPRKMECLGSYSSVVGGALHHAAPMLSQSLLNYVRADLTAHVSGWPADILEKQAIKFTEEAYQLGCLQCTRVSAELKCSRSLVRHTEIQATLQEQKIMYLRQQISRLEELKSQNSFMSDE